MITSEYLEKCRKVDIENVNKSELVDIRDVHINTDLPVKERIIDYIQQIKNPYCYLDNGVVVKVSFAGKKSLDDCLQVAVFSDIKTTA